VEFVESKTGWLQMKNVRPPRLAQKLFNWYCGFANVEDLHGDLEEWFYLNAKTKSHARAKRIYWKQVLSLLFSYAVRKRKANSKQGIYSSDSFSFSMLQNYLKVALRNIYQYRYFSILNAFGLAIGMSVSLLLISMYSYVSTYDNFHQHEENIYAITTDRTEAMEQRFLASAPVVLGDRLREEFAGASEVVRIYSSFAGDVVREKENIPISGYFVDANFFSVFSFEIITGNSSTALEKPYSVVLTESAAHKIFGSLEVVGKALEVDGLGNLQVTGLIKDHPKNSHMEFEALVSYSTIPVSALSPEEQWTNYQNQYVYVLLNEDASLEELQQHLKRIENTTYKNSSTKVTFKPEALDGIVTSELNNAIGPQWENSGFIVFGVLAIVILLPGIFNYTNISIARALKRSKEIGLRKTMGGIKSQIFFQFITETAVITFISLIGALLIFFLIRTEFKSMLVEASMLDLSLTPRMLTFFVLFTLLVGFVAGVFPALHFAGLNPIQALKGQTSKRMFTATRLRKGLTIFQFGLSFCFVVCIIVFGRQYHTLLTFDFGFRKENIVNVELQGVDPQLFKNEFSKLAAVQSVALSSGTLGLSSSQTWVYMPDSKDSVQVNELYADADYVKLFNLQLVAGALFPQGTRQQEQHLVVNEEFVKAAQLGSPREAIGKTFLVDGKELMIIGVLKNFHYAPPGIPIGSFVFRMDPTRFTQANMNVDVADVYMAFTSMEKIWKTLSDREPFKAIFFEDELNEAYVSYRSILKIAGFLGLLALTISVLGLLGMVVYTSETRVKEVSIRKVLGATAGNLTLLLSRDYLKLILWAILCGLPVAILTFELVFSRIPGYQVNLTFWDVALSALALISLGLATITSQTYKAALTNPAETLRGE
jgi:putative ABC transport system permease protein